MFLLMDTWGNRQRQKPLVRNITKIKKKLKIDQSINVIITFRKIKIKGW